MSKNDVMAGRQWVQLVATTLKGSYGKRELQCVSKNDGMAGRQRVQPKILLVL